MKILFNKHGESLFLDEERHHVIHGKRKIDISPGFVISAGSTVRLEKNSYLILDPGPSILKSVARRGPQIIDPRDAAVMMMYSDMKQDSRILESGTGSGFLTSMILRYLSPDGSYLGIDQSTDSVEITRKNVGLTTDRKIEIVNMRFEEFDGMGRVFDCVFLDLPEPWASISSQRKYIVPGGRVVTYLPNYDQVERAVLEYERNGFYHFETDEILKREIIVRENATRPSSTGVMHTAFISCFIRKDGSEIILS
ncbi:MAG: methyltransferase domain-containing protein [Candidatus Thermoplasmatota archaeon]|nr:methyltransferase domain-containing protein [Candidatus Thermoplasmatota archaeon]